MTAEQIKQLANELVTRLRDDIETATNREHHIRASARANEAHLLLEGLNQMFDTSSTEDEDLDDLQEEA